MLSIRRATMDDLESVIDLRLAFLREMQPDADDLGSAVLDSTRAYVTEKLASGEFLVWLAEEGGRIVGTGGLVFFHRPPTLRNASSLHAYVLNMYTLPECRGRGIATALLQHILEHVKTTPAARVSLHASEMGRRVYERFGFTSTSTEMVLSLAASP